MTQEQLKAERRIASRSDPRPFVKQEWPYIAMLGAALVGVALESLTPQPMTPNFSFRIDLPHSGTGHSIRAAAGEASIHCAADARSGEEFL